MDVDSDISNYFEVIERQKRILQKAQSRKGQRPRDRKHMEQLYMEFMFARMATATKEGHERGDLIRSSFIPPAYLPCTTPLAQLTPIVISQLTLETHHRGRYLLLRVIAPPNRMTGILVLAADECDDAVVLQLYQQDDENVREAADIVDFGSTLLVKEPYFKVMASGDYGLRVDHLSDVMHIAKDDPILPNAWVPRVSEVEDSAEILKSKGDLAMGDGKYWKAIEEYSKAISQKMAEDRFKIIKRNRALAHLKTKQYDSALSDTGFPDFGSMPSEKALFRAAEALYFLQRFTECSNVLETLCSKFPDNKQALAVSERNRSRQLEASAGRYDFKLLQKEAKKLRPPQLDHATYIGPIEVKKSTGKGRGLFVTSPVKAGDLLLCEKAFSHAFIPEKPEGKSHITLLINPETGRGFMGGQADLMKNVVQKLYRNPSLSAAFTELYYGSYKPTSICVVDGTPVVDTFLVEQIMNLNVFGCPLSSLDTHNASIHEPKDQRAYHSCGIWIQASYINHSCVSNARRSFIGDMMIVRATRDLEPGDEISFWYHAPGHQPKKRQEKFKNWGFTCTCSICEDDKSTSASVIEERKRLLAELKRSFQPSSKTSVKVGKAERLLKALRESYTRPAHEVPRLLLWDPQSLMTQIYLAQDKVEEALESFQKALTSLGFVVTGADKSSEPFKVVKWGLLVDPLIEVFLQGRGAFESIGSWADSKTSDNYARIAYKMVIGEDASFESTYGG